MSIRRPWLRKHHPNFFLIYTATMIAFGAFGYLGVVTADVNFSAPAYKYINQFASHEAWGWWAAATAVVMFVGLHFSDFKVARIGLGLGFAWMLLRFLLFFEATVNGIPGAMNGLPVYFLGSALLLSQTLEPPVNPATERKGR